MTEYVSKQVKINKPDTMIYSVLSDFSNFTPMLKDKVENWCADSESCSFKAKGFSVKLKMIEKEPCKTIKITGDEMPFDICFWVQLQSIDANDTRMKLTTKIKLNPVLKMMVGKKLEKGIDDMAEHIANTFNSL